VNEPAIQNSPLLKPKQFWNAYRRVLPWNTFRGFRWALEQRHRNGLLQSGAVIHGPFGLLLDPERFFNQWLRGNSSEQVA
jgi:hypothetical protein